MKRLLLFTFTLLAMAVSAGAPPAAAQYSGCGVKPVKPVLPVGCRDLRLECQCDERGRNCKWVWICVKR